MLPPYQQKAPVIISDNSAYVLLTTSDVGTNLSTKSGFTIFAPALHFKRRQLLVEKSKEMAPDSKYSMPSSTGTKT
jgi:hypothetical protein